MSGAVVGGEQGQRSSCNGSSGGDDAGKAYKPINRSRVLYFCWKGTSRVAS